MELKEILTCPKYERNETFYHFLDRCGAYDTSERGAKLLFTLVLYDDKSRCKDAKSTRYVNTAFGEGAISECNTRY